MDAQEVLSRSCEQWYVRVTDLPITLFAGVQEEIVKDTAAGIARQGQLLRIGAEPLINIPIILVLLPAAALLLLWLVSAFYPLAWNTC